MTRAISIHIGLNNVDPNAYNGWDGTLSACVNDAQSMQNIANSLDYTSILILNEKATADRVISEIGQAAWNLEENGILLLTYSGHGGQVPDVNGDEADGKDETWVLYDRQLIDDELYNLWDQFGSGSRLVVVSDSCHSGTVSKNLEYLSLAEAGAYARVYHTRSGPPRFRAIPEKVGADDYQRKQHLYSALQFASGSRTRSLAETSVLLFSGCQDNQLSSDGDVNGLFTGHLLDIWHNGGFSGNYKAFYQAILNQMPSSQTPNYSLVGASNPGFEGQIPFTVDPPSDTGHNGSSNGISPGLWPSIKSASSVTRGGQPPSFTVNAGPGRVFVVEVATAAALFDITRQGKKRKPDNFYGSWSDTAFLQGSNYTLPSPVWQRLYNADRLYYRVGSAMNAHYDDYRVSSKDDAGEMTPSLVING